MVREAVRAAVASSATWATAAGSIVDIPPAYAAFPAPGRPFRLPDPAPRARAPRRPRSPCRDRASPPHSPAPRGTLFRQFAALGLNSVPLGG